MKRLLMASCVALFAMSVATAKTQKQSEQEELLQMKQAFDKKAYELKLKKESLKELEEKELFQEEVSLDAIGFFSKSRRGDDYDSLKECADWVYKGPGSYDEALEACKGVRNMECVEWVYQGPGSRMDAARACVQVRSFECVEWVYQGPGSRMEASEACRGVRSFQCVQDMYQRTSANRMESARRCSELTSPPGC